MFVIKWITTLLVFRGCLCQDTNHFYEQILQNAFQAASNPQSGLSNGDVLSFIGSVLQSSQDSIVSYLKNGLDGVLEATTVNSTNNVCLKHTELFLDALIRREDWALRMIDAMGKPEPGLLDYKLNWVGNFDECIAIKATTYKDPVTKSGPEHPYTGKYCTVQFQLGGGASGFVMTPGINIGMCLPESCSPEDGAAFVNAVTGLLPLNMTIPQATMTCQEKSIEFTDKALAATIFGGVFAAIILIATAFDVIVQHILSKKKSVNTSEKCQLKTIKGIDNSSFSHEMTEKYLSDGDAKVSENGKNPNDFSDVEIGKKSDQKAAYIPGILGKLLLSFSVYSNAPKILNTNQPKGTLTCVNGIRFLSMTWVILGHTVAFGASRIGNAATYIPQMFKRFTFQAILNATVSVDTFFALSGLLVSYLTLREMKKRSGALKLNWPLFYFHRYWRLTPPYMFLLFIYVTTFKYWATGPGWVQHGIDFDDCQDTWWKNLLYINNVYDSDRPCMGWSWYLSNDMQFYVISPIMLIPLYYSPVFGGIVCLLFVLVNFISVGMISAHKEFSPNIMFNKDVLTAMTEIYFKPWARIGPYVVGIFTGYILYKTECKVKMSKLLNLTGWAIATAMALVVLYGLYTSDGSPPNFSNGVSALYNATSRTAWGLSVAWVIFACATGYGGPVNALLSWPGIIPLSRLTYCAYLVHPIVIYYYIFSRKSLLYWDDVELTYMFLGHLCVSYAAAFVLSLAFESPMMGLEKVLLGRKKHS